MFQWYISAPDGTALYVTAEESVNPPAIADWTYSLSEGNSSILIQCSETRAPTPQPTSLPPSKAPSRMKGDVLTSTELLYHVNTESCNKN